MDTSRLIIQGLSDLDAEELLASLGENAQVTEPEVPEGSLAEPATITAIIMLTPMVVGAIAIWLSKRRRSYLLKQTVRIEHPDGRVEEKKLEIRASSEDEAKVEMAAEIAKWIPDIPSTIS